MEGYDAGHTAEYACGLHVLPEGASDGEGGRQRCPPPKKKLQKGTGGKKKIDTGKLLALHKAGWSNAKIANELGVSDVTVGKYLKQLTEEKENEQQSENV